MSTRLWWQVVSCVSCLVLGAAVSAHSQTQGGTPTAGERPATSAKPQKKPEPVQPGAVQGGRTSSELDAIPKFSMEYFVGEWTFEGIVADGPLGEGGPLSGTEIVRNVWDGRFWDIAIKGEGSDGKPFTGKGVLIYMDSFAGQSFVRHEVTRGVATLKTGTMSCDLGGTCGMYYETPRFEYNGSLLQLRGRYQLAGSYSYRMTTEISVDKGPYTNWGTIWYKRDERAAKPLPIK